jgi:hypothetical protein
LGSRRRHFTGGPRVAFSLPRVRCGHSTALQHHGPDHARLGCADGFQTIDDLFLHDRVPYGFRFTAIMVPSAGTSALARPSLMSGMIQENMWPYRLRNGKLK